MNRKGSITLAVRKTAGQWWFSGLTTVVGAFSGLCGSLYSDEIRGVFPFTVIKYGPIEWVAVGFWASLFLFGAMFAANVYAQNQNTDAQIQKLQKLINTLPPENFLDSFQKILDSTYRLLLLQKKNEHSKDSILISIKTNLTAIAFLAKIFDGDGAGVYSANIMLHAPIGPMSDIELQTYAPRILFLGDAGLDLRKSLSGVLVLQQEMAVEVRPGGGMQSPAVASDVVLPIPVEERRMYQGQGAVLPGAPDAFLRRGFTGYEDTKSLADFCRKNQQFHPRIADELEEYFNSPAGKEVKSFYSIAIPASHSIGTGSPDEPVAVLNIHANRPNILGKDEIELFMPLIRPFVLCLSNLLDEYRSI